jgi:hypothetical protein
LTSWILATDSGELAVGLVFPISVAEVITARKRSVGNVSETQVEIEGVF